jgi:hypothetical protein
MTVTAEGLGAVAGIVLTLAFSYIPGLNAWFAKLNKEQQQLGMLLALVVAALLIGGAGCLGWTSSVVCNADGLRDVGEALLFAIIANQSVYRISPQTKQVREVRAARSE